MLEKIKISTAMLLAMLIWGYSYIWSLEVFEYYNPSTTLLFRLILSSLMLFAINIFSKNMVKVKTKDLKYFVLIAFFQPFLYFIGENYGLMNTSPTVTSVFVATIPLFTPFVTYFVKKEKITIMNIIGAMVSVVGILLVIIKKDMSIIITPKGFFFLSIAVFSAITYTLLVSTISNRYNVMTVVNYQNIFGILWFIPAFLILDYQDFMRVGFRLEPFIPVFKLALFASTIAYIFFIYALKKMGVVQSMLWTNTIPIFTAMFSFFILPEEQQLNGYNIIGIFVVIAGLLLASPIINKKKPSTTPTAEKNVINQ